MVGGDKSTNSEIRRLKFSSLEQMSQGQPNLAQRIFDKQNLGLFEWPANHFLREIVVK